jgi:hypothetical protein
MNFKQMKNPTAPIGRARHAIGTRCEPLFLELQGIEAASIICSALARARPPGWTVHKPPIPDPYGTHHSKVGQCSLTL